jgi:hypothetical protein
MKRKGKKRVTSGMPKMPKWTPEKINEDTSVDFIREVFRGWRPVSLQQNDIGLDMRFEVIESNGDATGAEFTVQLKATKRLRTSDGAIAHSIKTSTANYFLVRPELVLFVVYHVREKKGYWVWVQEYLRRNWSSVWAQQQTVTIKVPLDNILDEASRARIAHRVVWHHEQQKWLAAARTSRNPNFTYEVSTSDQEIKVGVLPKYPDADKNNPIEVSGQLNINKTVAK